MSSDYIVDDVHRFREKIAKKYDYDISAIVAAAMKEQWKSGHRVVSFVPKPARPGEAAKRRAANRSTKRASDRATRKSD